MKLTYSKKQIMFILLVVSCQVLFMHFLNQFLIYSNQLKIQKHADAVKVPVWTYDKFALDAYLSLTIKSEDYEKIEVIDPLGRLYAQKINTEESWIIKNLRAYYLIPSYQVKSDIIHAHKKLGSIQAQWSGTIFSLVSIVVFIILVLTASVVWLILMLTQAKRDLEKVLSEIKRTNLKLIEARDIAERANLAKSTFIANMSHEIRSPLNAILGFGQILREREIDKKKSHFIEAIYSSGKLLLTIINDILDLSKIESGKLELQYSPVSIKVLIEEINGIFAHNIKEKGLDFSISIPTDFPNTLLLDGFRMRQILINLISNATKFTNEGFIKLSFDYKFQDPQFRNSVRLSITVQDTGIGIPEDQISKIFDPFEQVDHQKTEKYGGTGLGLNIVKKLIEKMEGKISVESKVNQGSIFKIDIPGLEVLEIEHTSSKEVKLLNFSLIKFLPATILIADDIEYNRELLTSLLESWDFKFQIAKNGQEVLGLIEKEEKPDIILLDRKMPIIDGFELSLQLKKDEKLQKIPIIMITASALKEDQVEIEKVCDRFIAKPIDKTELVNTLLDFLPHRIEAKDTVLKKTNEEIITTKDLPEHYITELLHHLTCGDYRKIKETTLQIKRTDPEYNEVCLQIEKLADLFDATGIKKLIENATGYPKT